MVENLRQKEELKNDNLSPRFGVMFTNLDVAFIWINVFIFRQKDKLHDVFYYVLLLTLY